MSHATATYATPRELAEAAHAAGFRGDDLINAVAIAMAESGGNLYAHNDRGEDSRGAWQINVGPGAHTDLASLPLYDLATNAWAAFKVYRDNAGFGPWTTYAGGDYRAHLAEASRAVGVLGLNRGGGFSLGNAIGLDTAADAITGGLGAVRDRAGNVLNPLKAVPEAIMFVWDRVSDPRAWWRALFVVGGVILFVVGVTVYARPAMRAG